MAFIEGTTTRNQKNRKALAAELINQYQTLQPDRKAPSFSRSAKGLGTLSSTLVFGATPNPVKAVKQNWLGQTEPGQVNAQIPFFFNRPGGKKLAWWGTKMSSKEREFIENWHDLYWPDKNQLAQDSVRSWGYKAKDTTPRRFGDAIGDLEATEKSKLRHWESWFHNKSKAFPAEHGMYPDTGPPGRGFPPKSVRKPEPPFPGLDDAKRGYREFKERQARTTEEYFQGPAFGDLPPSSELTDLFLSSKGMKPLDKYDRSDLLRGLLREIYNPSDRLFPDKATRIALVQLNKNKTGMPARFQEQDWYKLFKPIWERNY